MGGKPSIVIAGQNSTDPAHVEADIEKRTVPASRCQRLQKRPQGIGQAEGGSLIESAKGAVELAQIDLGNTIIRAPEDGRLGQITACVGQYVTPGTALVSHVGKDVWIIANFKETQLHGMRVGERASFTVDALGGQTFTGRIEAFSPATASEFSLLPASNAIGNFTKIAQRLPARIAIDPGQERSEFLTAGMSVVITIDTNSPGQAIAN